MNRSVLIVIVDFLLISLLAFSRFDEPDVVEKPITGTALPASGTGRQDLVDVLKVSLDKERESREQLNEQLRQAQAQLQGREQVLTDREKLMREAEALLREKAAEAARLARERAALQQQYASAQTGVTELQKQLSNTLSQASQSRQRLEAVRTDLQAREEEEAILKRKLAELEKTRQSSEAEKQQLATQLQIAETEKRLVREQLDTSKGEVLVERQEKAKLQEHATKLQEHATKLAEGVSVLAAKSGELKQEVTVLTEKSGELKQEVSALADKSGELKQEIRENRPLAPNSVFSEFVTNRVRADFRAVRSGVFGREINREKEAKSVLVRHGNQVYAIYHVNDTPLSFSFPGVDWDWLIANLRRGAAVVRVERMSFLAVDPRIVVVPIAETNARELGSKIYSLPKDPFKFQDAILVGANEGYYGECKFQMDAENPGYIRMQRERFSWLVGKFAPSSGDLVFTKGGELLGVMVNKDFCLVLTQFAPAYHIQMGIGIAEQQTGTLLSQLYSQVARMPVKLQ
jgi:hypothetical protein